MSVVHPILYPIPAFADYLWFFWSIYMAILCNCFLNAPTMFMPLLKSTHLFSNCLPADWTLACRNYEAAFIVPKARCHHVSIRWNTWSRKCKAVIIPPVPGLWHKYLIYLEIGKNNSTYHKLIIPKWLEIAKSRSNNQSN